MWKKAQRRSVWSARPRHICGQPGRRDWKSCVESAFIMGKHTNFLLFDDRYGWRCQSKQSSRSRVRTLRSLGFRRRTSRGGKLSGHHLSCSVPYFNTFGTSVKRIIKQQGHVWTSRHFIPLFLSGETGKYAWKTSGWRPARPNYCFSTSNQSRDEVIRLLLTCVTKNKSGGVKIGNAKLFRSCRREKWKWKYILKNGP